MSKCFQEAFVNARNHIGRTALHCATEERLVTWRDWVSEMIDLLVNKHGANVFAFDKHDRTPHDYLSIERTSKDSDAPKSATKRRIMLKLKQVR